MRRLALLALALAAAAAGCMYLKDNPEVCPEYRSLRCVGGTRCSMDRDRGCKVCQCEKMDDELPDRDPDDPSQPPE